MLPGYYRCLPHKAVFVNNLSPLSVAMPEDVILLLDGALTVAYLLEKKQI